MLRMRAATPDVTSVSSLFHLQEVTATSECVTLEKLKRGVEYCVQVELVIGLNKHCRPSAWKCTVTTRVDLQTGELVVTEETL